MDTTESGSAPARKVRREDSLHVGRWILVALIVGAGWFAHRVYENKTHVDMTVRVIFAPYTIRVGDSITTCYGAGRFALIEDTLYDIYDPNGKHVGLIGHEAAAEGAPEPSGQCLLDMESTRLPKRASYTIKFTALGTATVTWAQARAGIVIIQGDSLKP